MSKIRDYKLEILSSVEKIDELNNSLDISSTFNGAYGEAKQLISRVEPSLMFYGVYNAGKSTLLNAVFGELKASVADVPETHKVTSYGWGKFELVDTPGVNGPEEDFVISKSELRRHNIVMFVIDDSDTFDSAFIAKEIVEIMLQGKPLIVVLNNKQNSDQERVNIIKAKLYDNIAKAGRLSGVSNIDQKYDFISVNAEMAYKGKTQNKLALVKGSKIEELEILITDKLRNIDEIKMLIAPVDIIINELSTLLTILKKRVEENEDNYFANILQEISEKKSVVLDNLHTLIKLETRKYNELIYSSVISGMDIDELQKELYAKINDYIDREIQGFADVCNLELSNLVNLPQLQMKINQRNEVAVDNNIQTSKVKVTEYEKEDKLSNILDNVLDVISITSTPIKTNVMPPIPPVPLPVIVTVIKGVISLFKSNKVDEKKLEELQAEIECANAREREALNRKITAMQEARTQINIQLHKFEDDAISIAKESIVKLNNDAIQNINSLMSIANENLKAYSSAYDIISTTKMELISIKNQLL